MTDGRLGTLRWHGARDTGERYLHIAQLAYSPAKAKYIRAPVQNTSTFDVKQYNIQLVVNQDGRNVANGTQHTVYRRHSVDQLLSPSRLAPALARWISKFPEHASAPGRIHILNPGSRPGQIYNHNYGCNKHECRAILCFQFYKEHILKRSLFQSSNSTSSHIYRS